MFLENDGTNTFRIGSTINDVSVYAQRKMAKTAIDETDASWTLTGIRVAELNGVVRIVAQFHPNFGMCPLDLITDVAAPRSEDPALIIRVINF